MYLAMSFDRNGKSETGDLNLKEFRDIADFSVAGTGFEFFEQSKAELDEETEKPSAVFMITYRLKFADFEAEEIIEFIEKLAQP
ncbi:MAG: hypothetical protein IPK04_15960 [Bdellovibrionales bacterium]|nr:hypothetical protein [Bdellovibrionales bacterium]